MTTSSAPTGRNPHHLPHPLSPSAPEPVIGESSVAPDGVRRCLNCGAPLDTPFCAHCGQRDIEPTLSVREIAHELIAEHFGLDSKIARTLVALVRWPGRLTNEFIHGRRVRYVPPLRLYLSLSVLYFLISAITGTEQETDRHGVITTGGGVVRVDTSGIGRADSIAAARRAAGKGDARNAPVVESPFLRDTVHSNFVMRAVKRRAHARIEEFAAHQQQASVQLLEVFQHHLPDAVFLLVPMFALVLGVVYFGRHRYYAEHLVFALHMQAFIFAALIVSKLPIPLIGVFLFTGGAAYAYLALRTVYAEGRGRTIVKLGILGVGYGISLVLVMALLGLVVFFFG